MRVVPGTCFSAIKPQPNSGESSRTHSDFTPKLSVTVIMPVRNEAALIKRSLGAVLAQDYPHDRMEVIVVDGMSDDGTRGIVQEIIENGKHQSGAYDRPGTKPDTREENECVPAADYTFPVVLLDNPSLVVPPALNIGLRHSRSDVVVRVDGHCEIAPDYVLRCVEELRRTGAECVGGAIVTVGRTQVAQSIALAQSSFFGVGGAAFRTGRSTAGYVDTVAFGAYRREVINRLGGFDEELVRNQDDEFNSRLIHSGGRIWLSPSIRSLYHSRSSLTRLWHQYFQYGFWKVRVLQKHPRQMRLRQFAPPTLMAGLLVGALFSPFSTALLYSWLALLGFYAIANSAASLWAAHKHGWRHLPFLPVAFFSLHCSYGLGFLAGLVKFWSRWKDRPADALVIRENIGQENDDYRGTSDLDRLRIEYADRDRRITKKSNYSPFNLANLFFLQQRQRAILKVLRQRGFDPLEKRRILELGCGRGGVLLEFLSYGAAPELLHGTDLLLRRVKDARRLLPHVGITCADGQHLPYQSGSFDLVLQHTVFSSILDDHVRASLALEMIRVLQKPGGVILWYDFWLNPTNPHTRGIRIAEVKRLFPSCRVEVHSLTLAPPIARRVVRVSWSLALLLENLKVLNTHYLIVITPRLEISNGPGQRSDGV